MNFEKEKKNPKQILTEIALHSFLTETMSNYVQKQQEAGFVHKLPNHYVQESHTKSICY
jgi:hypothetical protein